MSTVHAFDGCYEAARAAALSGVPKSTVYDWARKDVVVPSVSREREMLWSYADLMALRIVSWLRHPKQLDGETRPATAMSQVRDALVELERRDLDLWDGRTDRSPLVVDSAGQIIIVDGERASEIHGQLVAGALLDLLGPFDSTDGGGPDLRRPRAHLRIVPGKCAGEPHLDGSRVTTTAIAALAERGFGADEIAALYPDVPLVSIDEAIELERTLGTVAVAA